MNTLYFLLGLIIIAAVVALESRKLRVAISAFGLAGFGFCLSYIMLGSWDLAIIQLAIELGLLIYLMFTASPAAGEPESYSGGQLMARLGSLIFAAILIGFAYLIFKTLPAVNIQAGLTLPDLYDLIGIGAALFAAVVGALTVLRPEGRQ
jgi:uncharacterized MnhB-related membrane protein